MTHSLRRRDRTGDNVRCGKAAPLTAWAHRPLLAILTQHNDLLRELGCSVYEVGINADARDTVFVVEVWDSQEAHRRSIEHPAVQASIAAARPILSGDFGDFRFTPSRCLISSRWPVRPFADPLAKRATATSGRAPASSPLSPDSCDADRKSAQETTI